MDFVHIWYDDRHNSKKGKTKVQGVPQSPTAALTRLFMRHFPAHAYDLKVEVTDLKSLILKVFKSSYFPNHMMDFVHI